MLVDDSVQDKRYSRFIELVKLQYSGAEHGPVRGIGIVNLVHGAGVRKDFYPMDYRFLLIHSWNLSRFPPQMAEFSTPQSRDADGECLPYDDIRTNRPKGA
jgi:hypothetical protein